MKNSLAAERKNGPTYHGIDQKSLKHGIDTDYRIEQHM